MSARIVYNPGSGDVTITIARGPLNFNPYVAARGHRNRSTSGAAQETVVENLDLFIAFEMPHLVIGDDIEAWATFEMWALAGGGFKFYPNVSVAGTAGEYYNCVAEDSGWQPQRNGPKKYGAKVAFFVLNDSQAPASPAQVLRRFYGITG